MAVSDSEGEDDGEIYEDREKKEGIWETMTQAERKALKKVVKAEKKDRRVLKKTLKNAFTDAAQMNRRQDVGQMGSIRPGISVKVLD